MVEGIGLGEEGISAGEQRPYSQQARSIQKRAVSLYGCSNAHRFFAIT